jgi:hypothetical protein
VYVKVTRMDPALGGSAQFRIRAREATVYGRWLTAGNDFHVEVENTTADAMCVEVARYPASGLAYTAGPGWSGALASFTLTVPAFGAVKQVIPSGSLVGAASEGTLRIGACASPTNLMASGLHVNTYAFNPSTSRYIYFFTSTANDRRAMVAGTRAAESDGRASSGNERRTEMDSPEGADHGTIVATWAGVVVACLGLTAPALAEGGPAGHVGANARVIVPDGSSCCSRWGRRQTRWFVFGTEPGRATRWRWSIRSAISPPTRSVR